MPLEPGTRLGPYEILGLAGSGGMGEVYRAHDSRLRRTVAIKVASSAINADPQARARFQHEARAIAAPRGIAKSRSWERTPT
jgi:serine/threonine protein kinase